jgi:predicted Zn-dependent protease
MAVLERECVETLEILGHVYFLQGRPREARIVFNGILALDEGNESALKHLAALDLEEGDGRGALRRLEACASQTGKHVGGPDPRLWLMRAKALQLEGQNAEAGENLAEYVRQNNKNKPQIPTEKE